MWQFVFIICILSIIFNLWVRLKRSGKLANAIPGPAPYPFFGNMLSFNISSNQKLWNVMREISRNYYPITRVWMTTQALFSIRHPADLEILLTNRSTITKGFVYELLKPWLRTGILTSTGKKWHERRKILTQAFHFNILKKHMNIMSEQAINLVEYLKKQGNESIQNFLPLASNFTLNVICETSMGVDLNKLDIEDVEKYRKAIYDIGRIVVWRMPRPFITDWMLKMVPFLQMNRDYNRALTHVHQFTDKVVQERREYHKKTNYKYLEDLTDDPDLTVDDVYTGRRRKLALIDLLFLAEKNGLIDNAGIIEEVDNFMFAGHDTSATTMTFASMLFAEHPDVQSKARAEVTKVLDKSNGNIGVQELKELQYLEQCIKETLRLYPPVSTIFRHTSSELQLKHALIPRKSHVICHLYDCHRDPHFWDNPDKYDPDNFSLENTQKRHPYAYLPFSAGPRNCLGQKFAMIEMKTFMAQILYNFHIEPVDLLKDVSFQADIVLRPMKAAHIKFVLIDQEKHLKKNL
ncbi:hypothetical protein TKK_0015792 [Trichogramma kaykai]